VLRRGLRIRFGRVWGVRRRRRGGRLDGMGFGEVVGAVVVEEGEAEEVILLTPLHRILELGSRRRDRKGGGLGSGAGRPGERRRGIWLGIERTGSKRRGRLAGGLGVVKRREGVGVGWGAAVIIMGDRVGPALEVPPVPELVMRAQASDRRLEDRWCMYRVYI
jgi:hypothetical protein